MLPTELHSQPVTFPESEDQRLQRKIRIFLSQFQVAPSAQLEVHVSQGTVVLKGIARSRRDKLRLFECCRHVAGVVRVVDHLEVGGDS